MHATGHFHIFPKLALLVVILGSTALDSISLVGMMLAIKPFQTITLDAAVP